MSDLPFSTRKALALAKRLKAQHRIGDWEIVVEGDWIQYTNRKTGKVLSKTYPSEHAVRVINGRLARKDVAYLRSLVTTIEKQQAEAAKVKADQDRAQAETADSETEDLDDDEDDRPAMAASAPE